MERACKRQKWDHVVLYWCALRPNRVAAFGGIAGHRFPMSSLPERRQAGRSYLSRLSPGAISAVAPVPHGPLCTESSCL